MLKVLGISLLLSVVGGFAIGLLGKFFVMSIVSVMALASVGALVIAFTYTFPAIKALSNLDSSSGINNTKVS